MSKSRLLSKTFEGGYFLHSGTPGEAPTVSPNTWHYTEATSPSSAYSYGILYQTSYFDLGGYELEDLTTYPMSYNVQNIGMIGIGATNFPSTGVETFESLTLNKVHESDLTNIGEFVWHLPGSPLSTFGMDEVLSGQWKRYTDSTDYSQVLQTGAESWGTGDSTGGRKLFITRAVKFLLTGSGIDFEIPDAGVVAPIMVDKEGDLEYLMRLKRSYELQGAV